MGAEASLAVHSLHNEQSFSSHGPQSAVPNDVSRHAILVFSSDALAAALLAAAAELAGHAPCFARADETARNAVRRVRPRLVLIDVDHEETCSDEFIGPALMMQARVLMVRSKRSHRDASDLVDRLELRVLELPADYGSLTRQLNEELDR